MKKSKSREPFWSYQLNTTADLANLAQFWVEWAGLEELFSWELQNGSMDFQFFICPGCRIFILCEIHCYFCPHIFCVNHFSLSQCCFDCWVGSYQDKWWHLCADWLMPQTKDIWIVSKYRCNLRLLKKAKILDSWHQNMSKKIGHWARLEWKKCPVFTTYKGCINPVCHSNSVFNCKMCFYEQKYWMEIAHCEHTVGI